ncbi:conjugal transfer protein TraS [Sphaerisporangium krabiense]|uniref:S-DNA-T family DNA segregation ATPase FtsK/SpoIIIE n=1 Tax=Sphaerisporangium krabiense TaxID=763782 RepID=A0A7W9DSB3_9ACTN|nr:FtsK/SpoIIIE domain-containing protein [Sphaerisporangium krabiense]MBB5629512.1 S-DNA-T family DNA segregation ATPase FtsK/SpoIIIE [Sphaerisporangium krabiense]GII65636.1 conjugal transfer protein TraS [Sphaerisporangium krabiense]
MTLILKQKRRIRRVEVERAPRLGLIRPTKLGFRVSVRLHDGQTPEDYARVLDKLAHAWKVHSVRLVSWRPGKVTLVATLSDPLDRVSIPVLSDGLLRVRVGLLDTGTPFAIDFRAVPHWLNVGATQSGKSNLANVLIVGLAPQPVALVGFDLKGGVEFTPYQARMSALATERAECAELLADLIGIIKSRMALCRAHRVKNIWHPRLPESARPMPIVVLVDEVAELFLMADPKSEKEEVAAVATRLLRIAQLGRAFGIYLKICGQRVGSDLGPGVTALRAQLTGRICHMVNDDETAKMALGDMDAGALVAARQISPAMPGTAIVIGSEGRWHRMRSVHVTEEQAEAAAAEYAHLTPSWADLTRGAGSAGDVDDSEMDEFTIPDLEDLPV